MATKASTHIKPCNIGQSEAHNLRTPEYLAHIDKSKVYIREDLTCQNESWISPAMEGITLQQYYDDIANMVKEKTGRAIQDKDVEYTDKKTGKKKKRKGSSPIREDVINCKADTTMAQVQAYCDRVHKEFGITPIQIFIHRDEGHWEDGEKRVWLPNHHIHIVWDWMDHNTGKSFKLNEADMSRMQDIVAESLNMERGKKKSETGREHLDRNDFIIAKQKQTITLIDEEITAKKEEAKKLDKENTESIKFGIANIFGKGKYAEIARRNKELEESIPQEKARLQTLYTQQLNDEIAKRTSVFSQEKTKLQANVNSLTKQNQSLLQQLQASNESAQQKNKEWQERVTWRDSLLMTIAQAYYKTSELFKRIIDAIIDYARSRFGGKGHHGAIFYNNEVADIKKFMNQYSADEDGRKAVGNWLVGYAEVEGNLSPGEYERAISEVDDIAEGRYDHRLRRESNGLGM